jgi:hypothetical protein
MDTIDLHSSFAVSLSPIYNSNFSLSSFSTLSTLKKSGAKPFPKVVTKSEQKYKQIL